MTNDQALMFAERIFAELNTAKRGEPDLTIMTVAHWLDEQCAGFPHVALVAERVREEAALWAASAQEHELEAYIAAAIVALEKSPITGKAAKRLAALGYRHMDAPARQAFAAWMEKHEGTGNG